MGDARTRPEAAFNALNRFLHDIYHGQEIVKAAIPAEQVLANEVTRWR